jgi:hypothetical protein
MRQARGADHSQETPCLRQEEEEVRVTKGHHRVEGVHQEFGVTEKRCRASARPAPASEMHISHG